MEMSEIYNGSQWANGIFLVNKAGATEYITGRSSTLHLAATVGFMSHVMSSCQLWSLNFT